MVLTNWKHITHGVDQFRTSGEDVDCTTSCTSAVHLGVAMTTYRNSIQSYRSHDAPMLTDGNTYHNIVRCRPIIDTYKMKCKHSNITTFIRALPVVE